jgi:hypothetical protein
MTTRLTRHAEIVAQARITLRDVDRAIWDDDTLFRLLNVAIAKNNTQLMANHAYGFSKETADVLWYEVVKMAKEVQ